MSLFSVANPTGSGLAATDFAGVLRVWWNDHDAFPNNAFYNIPTLADENTSLERVELRRYTKNPYMLKRATLYTRSDSIGYTLTGNTYTPDLTLTEKDQWVKTGELEMDYECKIIRRMIMLTKQANTYKFATNGTRNVFLLKRIKNMPLDALVEHTTGNNSSRLGNRNGSRTGNPLPTTQILPTITLAQVPTTHFDYEHINDDISLPVSLMADFSNLTMTDLNDLQPVEHFKKTADFYVLNKITNPIGKENAFEFYPLDVSDVDVLSMPLGTFTNNCGPNLSTTVWRPTNGLTMQVHFRVKTKYLADALTTATQRHTWEYTYATRVGHSTITPLKKQLQKNVDTFYDGLPSSLRANNHHR
jgi:hypothetical protein